MDPHLVELMEEGAPTDEVEVILELQAETRPPTGVRIIARFGTIVTARVRRDRLLPTWRHPDVASVKAPRLIAPEDEMPIVLDGAPALREVDHAALRATGATGRGTCVAVVDWGIDICHPNFRNADGSTRILALWDQSNPRVNAPPYGYGAVFWRDDIDAALRTADPYAALAYHPADADPLGIGTHGCHVTDVAAGNGRAPGSVPGVAPEADIIFVHLAAPVSGPQANLGNTSRILEAFDFLSKVAGPRPWCANLSVGKCGGPHTGRTLVEEGLEALLAAAPNRALSQSVGNYHDARTHASGLLGRGERRTLTWRTDAADLTPNELEVYYDLGDRLGMEIAAPEGRGRWTVPLGTRVVLVIDGVERGRAYHRARDPVARQNHIDILLDPQAPAGAWTIALTGEDIADGRFNTWIERDSACATCQSHFDEADVDPRSTTGTLANNDAGITSGAYDPALSGWPIASFSSSGPTASGVPRPHVLAPGVEIPGARSSPRVAAPDPSYVVTKTGTSQAAPHTTGVIACMLQVAPRPLWDHEIRSLLQATALPMRDASERDRAGSGYLVPRAAVEAARSVSVQVPPPTARVVAPALVSAGGAAITSEGDATMDSNESGRRPCGCAQSGQPEQLVERPAIALEDATEAVRKRHVILISGGPGGYFVATDPQHDQSWANYASPPLLLTDTPDELKAFAASDEDVWWLVYKEAYDRRWADDAASRVPARVAEVKRVRDLGFASYWDMISARARDRHWELRPLASASDLWTKLGTFRKHSISRVLYWGHAAGDLWLTVGHTADGDVTAPADSEIIDYSSIPAALKDRFEKGDPRRRSVFTGCNTSAFAREWSAKFDVSTEGVEGYVHFKSINITGGLPCLLNGAEQVVYSPGAVMDFDLSPSMVLPACAPAVPAASTTSGSANVPSSREGESILDLVESVAGEGHSLDALLETPYDVLARPFERLPVLRRGDVVLRIAPGERFRHVCVVASGELAPLEQVGQRGWRNERGGAGEYAVVIEGGAFPHRSHDVFARRMSDGDGRLPANQFVIRLRSYGAQPLASRLAGRRFRRPTRLPYDYAGESAGTSVTFTVENRYGHFHKATEADVDWVEGCTVELVEFSMLPGTSIPLLPHVVASGVTDVHGKVTIDLDGIADGTFGLNVSPRDQSTDPVGPTTATTAPVPKRIWRPITGAVTVVSTKITACTDPHVTITGRSLAVKLQPVWMASPNHRARPTVGASPQDPTLCVIHHTDTLNGALQEFFLQDRSAHYIVDTDGEILKFVDDAEQSFHAGKSQWGGVDSVNEFSIGIEQVNSDGQPYTNEQYDALIGLLGRIRAAHPTVTANSFVGHSDIATCPQPGSGAGCATASPRRLGRKSSDPGDLFDWPRLAAAGFGVAVPATALAATDYGGFFTAHPASRLTTGDNDTAHRYGGVVRPGIAGVVRELQEDLQCIGYFCPPDGTYGIQTRMAVMVFQEHFVRPTTAHSQEVDADTARAIKAVRTVVCPPPVPASPATAGSAAPAGTASPGVDGGT